LFRIHILNIDHIVFLGDLVSKGPHSSKVVKLAMDLGASAVIGNHDYELLTWMGYVRPLEAEDEEKKPKDKSTDQLVIGSKEEIAKTFNPKAAEWMLKCPYILRVGEVDGEELVAVHGGLLPGTSLKDQGIIDSRRPLISRSLGSNEHAQYSQ